MTRSLFFSFFVRHRDRAGLRCLMRVWFTPRGWIGGVACWSGGRHQCVAAGAVGAAEHRSPRGLDRGDPGAPRQDPWTHLQRLRRPGAGDIGGIDHVERGAGTRIGEPPRVGGDDRQHAGRGGGGGFSGAHSVDESTTAAADPGIGQRGAGRSCAGADDPRSRGASTASRRRWRSGS